MPKRKTKAATRDSYEVAGEVIPPHCKSCGSTDREPYHNIVTRDIAGTLPSGFVFTRVSWKRTTCKGCGQKRIDRHYENKSAARKPGRPKPENDRVKSGDGIASGNSESTGKR